MADSAPDVVIVGGGIAGMTTAYYLSQAGVPSVVCERAAIGSPASGFAYGGLSPLSGFGIPHPGGRAPRRHGPARARDRPAVRRRAHHRRGPWMLPAMADAQVAQQTACLR